MVLAIAVAVGGAGCHHASNTSSPRLVLDGRPRYADDQGVVTTLDSQHIVLDGKRSHRLTDKVRVFATATMEPVPLSGRLGQYVQLGLKGDTIAWVATFTAIVQLPGTPRLAFHIGTLERVDAKRRAIFRDGTVLALDEEAAAPPSVPVKVRADIDVDLHRIRELVQLSD
ncbi:MAG: hypothetical protein H0W70_14595 [Actinobacteria bacterium]|nr:hypothetical protein [Actinomycetota bacterium]